jgi:hypothetical protein
MVFTRWQWYYNKTQHTHNTSHKITHTLKQNTTHKTTQAIKDTLHKMNTMQIKLHNTNIDFLLQQKQLQLQLNKLIKNKYAIH